MDRFQAQMSRVSSFTYNFVQDFQIKLFIGLSSLSFSEDGDATSRGQIWDKSLSNCRVKRLERKIFSLDLGGRDIFCLMRAG
jgi:hypothetical protein